MCAFIPWVEDGKLLSTEELYMCCMELSDRLACMVHKLYCCIGGMAYLNIKYS